MSLSLIIKSILGLDHSKREVTLHMRLIALYHNNFLFGGGGDQDCVVLSHW
jgi:hypothetical protein